VDQIATALENAINGLVKPNPVQDSNQQTPNQQTPNQQTPNQQTSNQQTTTKLDYTKDLARYIKNLRALNLDSKKYSTTSWNALLVAYRNARNMDILRDADSQAKINAAAKNLLTAYKGLTKRDVDLTITNVKRVGNDYRVTIRNSGKDASTATRVLVTTGNRKYQKTAAVKSIGAGKSITVLVKFYKHSIVRKNNKHFIVNDKKQATETNYKNNRALVPRLTG